MRKDPGHPIVLIPFTAAAACLTLDRWWSSAWWSYASAVLVAIGLVGGLAILFRRSIDTGNGGGRTGSE